ncbi:hypothetical protein D3C72_1558580 [compost metagenome]
MNPIIVTGTGRHGGNHRNAPRKYTMRRTSSRIEAARGQTGGWHLQIQIFCQTLSPPYGSAGLTFPHMIIASARSSQRIQSRRKSTNLLASGMSGGNGHESVRNMQAIAGQFDVRLSFQDPSEGSPVSGVTLILPSRGAGNTRKWGCATTLHGTKLRQCRNPFPLLLKQPAPDACHTESTWSSRVAWSGSGATCAPTTMQRCTMPSSTAAKCGACLSSIAKSLTR